MLKKTPLAVLVGSWLVFLGVVLGGVARADVRFTPSDLDLRVTGSATVVVVPAGRGSAERDAAVRAFTDQLDAAGHQIVPPSAGPLVDESDADIVRTAAGPSVEPVAVVRDAEGSTTVRVYDRTGSLVASFAAHAGPGASWARIQAGGIAVTTERSFGSYRKQLSFVRWNGTAVEPEDFYREVGRDDLAGSYRRRVTTRTVLWVGALAVETAALVELVADQCGDSFGDCIRAYEWSAGLAAAGFALSMVASFLDVDPIDVDEARRLADGHNRMLPAGAAPAPPMRIAPVMGAGGGGLVLRGEF